MDKFRRVEKVKEETEKCDEEIRLTAQGSTSAYVGRAGTVFNELLKDFVVLKATGGALTKAVTTAEVIKRRFKGLHQITKVGSIEVTDEYTPLEEGLETVFDTRTMPFIEITLSKKELDTSDVGYQPPIDESLVKDVDPEEISKGRGRGKGRGKGKSEEKGKGKGKGKSEDKGKGKGKGKGDDKGKGKGKDDKGKGKGKGKEAESKGKGKGKSSDDKGKGKGKGKSNSWDEPSKGKGSWGYSSWDAPSKGKSKGYDSWGSSKGGSKGGYDRDYDRGYGNRDYGGGYGNRDSGYGNRGYDNGKGSSKGKGKSAWGGW